MRRRFQFGWLLVLAGSVTAAVGAQQAPRWSIRGLYIESCTCSVPCGCVIRGEVTHGCRGVNVFRIDSGRYGQTNLAGVRLAVPHQPGDWAIVYFDSGVTEAQQEAMLKILEPRHQAFKVKVVAVRTAPIAISGADGAFKVTVGDAVSLATQPVMGLDKRRSITYRNMPEPMIQNCFQARTVSGFFKDAERGFELNDTNSFWSNLNVRG